jgi:L-aminopeptidase/D-esterase-like protein
LTDVKGLLVGVTTAGGSSSANAGTVFDVSTGQSTLLNLNGTLYGTTYLGGGDGCDGSGCGTAFALTP